MCWGRKVQRLTLGEMAAQPAMGGRISKPDANFDSERCSRGEIVGIKSDESLAYRENLRFSGGAEKWQNRE